MTVATTELVWAQLPSRVLDLQIALQQNPSHPRWRDWYTLYTELKTEYNCGFICTLDEWRYVTIAMHRCGMAWDTNHIRLKWPQWRDYMSEEEWQTGVTNSAGYRRYSEALQYILEYQWPEHPGIPGYKLERIPGWYWSTREIETALEAFSAADPFFRRKPQGVLSQRVWAHFILFLRDAYRLGQGVRLQ